MDLSVAYNIVAICVLSPSSARKTDPKMTINAFTVAPSQLCNSDRSCYHSALHEIFWRPVIFIGQDLGLFFGCLEESPCEIFRKIDTRFACEYAASDRHSRTGGWLVGS